VYETFKNNPFKSGIQVGTRTKYVSVDGLVGLADGGELVRDAVYIKREQKYDKRKFVKLYVGALLEISELGINGFKMIMKVMSEMDVGKDYVYLAWTDGCGVSKSSFRRGVNELLDKSILAKSDFPCKYWVDTSMFNRG